MKLYRIMKIGPGGKPLEGRKRNMLGVRPTDPTNATPGRRPDVAAVSDSDIVEPGEGLSTSHDPNLLRVGAGEALFEIDTDHLPAALESAPDRSPHFLIQPSAPITLGEFQQALADTEDLWVRVR